MTSRLGQRLRVHFWRKIATARNARFSTRMRFAADAPVLLLSPHLDDAVLDCWSVLTADEPCSVVNVFAWPPASGITAHWDRLAGATDSAARVRERIVEDRGALARASATPVNLPFLEGGYRVGARAPSFAEIDGELARHVPAASLVYAPINLGHVHSDHRLVRDYALALALQGARVRLYADVPYAVEYGWPAWVTGLPPDPYLDVDAFWAASSPPVRCDAGAADVVRLDAPATRAKLEAMRDYRTQFPTLDRGPIGRLANPAIHGFEVFFDAAPGKLSV